MVGQEVGGGGSRASRMSCAASPPKTEGWGKRPERCCIPTPQEVSLTTTMRQMPGERGQPHKRGLLHSPSPMKELPSELKWYQVS